MVLDMGAPADMLRAPVTDNLLTSAEAAQILGVTPDRVRQLARRGELAAVMVIGINGQRLYARDAVESLRIARSKR